MGLNYKKKNIKGVKTITSFDMSPAISEIPSTGLAPIFNKELNLSGIVSLQVKELFGLDLSPIDIQEFSNDVPYLPEVDHTPNSEQIFSNNIAENYNDSFSNLTTELSII